MEKHKSSITKKQKQSLKRLYILTAVSGIVCAMLAVSVFVFFFVPLDKDVYILTLPKLVGLDEGSIGRYDGVKIKREWVYSDTVEYGKVISQSPHGGAKRKLRSGEEYDVTVFISLGEKTEAIPELSGVEEMNAAAALRSIGAYVRSVSIYSDGEAGCEDGTVLYSSPACGEKIKQGECVTIFVSRRRVNATITVPSFFGLELSEAYRRALLLGLCISDRDVIPNGDAVISQSLPEGANVPHGSYISFKTEKKENDREWPPIISENEDIREGFE